MGRILLYFYHLLASFQWACNVFPFQAPFEKLHEIEELRAHGRPTIITDYITMMKTPVNGDRFSPFIRKQTMHIIWPWHVCCAMFLLWLVSSIYLSIEIHVYIYIYPYHCKSLPKVFQHVKPQIPCLAKSMLCPSNIRHFWKAQLGWFQWVPGRPTAAGPIAFWSSVLYLLAYYFLYSYHLISKRMEQSFNNLPLI